MILLPDAVIAPTDPPASPVEVPSQEGFDNHRVPPQWNADCSGLDCIEPPERTVAMMPK